MHPEAVEKARAALPTEAEVAGALELQKASADPTRMRILLALRAAQELCVCDLAVVVGMSESAVSHQLRLLRSANLVSHRKEGRHVFYRLADAHVNSILNSALEHSKET